MKITINSEPDTILIYYGDYEENGTKYSFRLEDHGNPMSDIFWLDRDTPEDLTQAENDIWKYYKENIL